MNLENVITGLKKFALYLAIPLAISSCTPDTFYDGIYMSANSVF